MRNPVLGMTLALAMLPLGLGGAGAQTQTDPNAPFPPASEQAGFRDHFNALDKKRWYVSDGWSNGDHQDCVWSAGAVQVRDGMLTLFRIPAPETGDDPKARCGEVQTNAFFRYGTFEARIRTARVSGMNASVFTYSGPAHKYPHSEIDIEILTRDTSKVEFNTYVEGKPMNGQKVSVEPRSEQAFHRFAIRWEPTGIRWYIDGRQVHRTPDGAALPDFPQKLYMSFWSTTTLVDWMGPLNPDAKMQRYDIDWVAYTPPGKKCLFPESVTCQP